MDTKLRQPLAFLWHGKEIDRVRAQSALAVIKQHPGLVLFAVSPVIIALGSLVVGQPDPGGAVADRGGGRRWRRPVMKR